MKENINQAINVDNIEEYLYNNTNIEKFTYEDYLKYKEKFYLEEETEKYKYTNVNNEHDKIFRTILDDKKEAVNLINKALKVSLTEKDIQKYKENYITEKLINKETDIVYKIKKQKVFILIEHQTRIDYSMPYRIMEYQYKIIESAVETTKIKQKNYKIPLVIPIVLYTGRKKWNAKEYIKEAQESFHQYNGNEIGKYNVIDVNDYTEEELLKEKTFLSKAMLIESKRGTNNLVDYLEKIINIVNKNGIYTKEHRKLLSTILDLSLRRKINNNEITNNLLEKIRKEGGENMLAILDMIDEENRKILNKGRREGKREILDAMKKNNYTIEQIMQITGLSKKEIEKYK